MLYVSKIDGGFSCDISLSALAKWPPGPHNYCVTNVRLFPPKNAN